MGVGASAGIIRHPHGCSPEPNDDGDDRLENSSAAGFEAVPS